MTCIVSIRSKNDLWMGCDSCCGLGDQVLEYDNKIGLTAGGKVCFGLAGDLRHSDLIQNKIIPQSNIKKNNGKLDKDYLILDFSKKFKKVAEEFPLRGYNHFDNFEMLIGNYFGDLYFIHSNFSVTNVKDYSAIGSGSHISLGVLYATKEIKDKKSRILKALRASQKHLSSVRSPFIVYRLSNKKGDLVSEKFIEE